MTDFSTPQRMSAGAFLIILANTFNKFISLIIVIIGVKIFNSGESLTDGAVLFRILISLGVLLAVVILISAANYFPKKFYVKDGKLIVSHGLLFRQTTTIPLSRIHTTRTKRGVVYQILGMRGITFDTLASKVEEIELILNESDWQSLLAQIEKEENAEPELTEEPATTQTTVPAPAMQFDNAALALDALCQNHLKGLAVLGSILAVIIDRLNDFSETATETVANQTYSYLESLVLSPIFIAGIVIVLYAIVLMLWLGKVFLRYFDMSAIFSKTLLTFNYGLLARASCRFAYTKVCTIWVKRNVLEKHFGLCTLMLRQAFNVTDNKEEENLKLYGCDTSDKFLRWWLGNDYASESTIITGKSGNGVILHVMLPAIVVSVIGALVLCHFGLYGWTCVPAIILVIYLFKGICAMRRSRIELKETYVIINNGHFAEIRNYLKYSNVEVVRIVRTPFTRRFHRVAIVIATPGTTFKVRSLREEQARQLYELLLQNSEISVSAPL
ncbi:MAG: PH domain-containing protein [Firmicutes bacterium]|nr:PH domain-containing protein [Bacillota bacterium]MCM1400543.1 PH domain-containing protein [Bacteroides sp.]MCM1476447.1 PH domain-containing protein [Bacteroides sp.]